MSAVVLHCRDTGGDGDAVLLAHAIGCDHRMWDSLVEALAPRHRVIALDARGHGSSPVPARPYALEAMADDAAALLDRLGVQRVHWVGLSMGGMVGQAFAIRHAQRLGKLVLANTTASYGPGGRETWHARIKLVEDGGLAAIQGPVATRYFSEAFRAHHPDVVASIMARFLETPVDGYLGCCDAIAELDFSRELSRITASTLVIAGSADIGTPVSMSEALAAAIPDARLAVIEGAAHLSVAEKPREFADLVRRFFGA